MALTRLPSFTLLNTDSYTFGNANISGNVSAGNIKTDHLLYSNGSPYAFSSNAAGSNTQIQFNDGNSYAGSANLTYNKTTKTLNVDSIKVTGNITPTANITYDLGNATNRFRDLYLSGNTLQIGDGSITIDGNSIVMTNPAGGTFVVDGSNASYASIASYVSEGNQSNITQVGTLVSLDVLTTITTGNIKTDHLKYANGVDYTFFDGEYSSLANTPSLFSGSYTDLTNKPTLGTAAATNANAYATAAQGTKADTAIQSGANISVFTNDSGYLVASNLSTYATQTYVSNAIANVINAAPAALDTLQELANALGNDASYSTSITNALANKLSTSNFASTANTWIATQTTSNLSEGTNQYYTVTRANTAIDARVTKSFVDALGVVANVANTALSVNVANVTGIGNIATINKDGNASNILYGNGVFASAPVTYGNSNVATYLASFGSNTISTTGNISVGNLSVTSNATVSGTLSANTITTSGSSGNISGANWIIANYFQGNGSSLTSLTGANVTGFVPNANVANSSTVAASANSVAVANVSGIGNIATVNKDGNASNILYGNGVFAAAPVTYGNSNVATFLANFGSNTISTTGNISAGNLSVTSNITVANANVTGTLSASTISTSGGSGNITGANWIIANYFQGNGSSLSAIAGANVTGQVANATVAGTVYTNAQPNITSVGTLTSVTTSGDGSIGGNLTVTGNLTVSGTTTTVNSTTVNINDINIVLANNATTAAQANGAGITINGASATMIYNSTSNSFVFSHPISANGALLTSLAGANVTGFVPNANVANTAFSVAAANVTGLGNLATINKDGNSSNILYGNGVFASAPVTYGDSNVATYLPTYTGNLSPGNLSIAPANLKISGGTANYVLKTDGAGNLSWTAQSGGGAVGALTTVDSFTGDGANATFTLSTTPTDANYTIAVVHGMVQPKSAYSVTGNSITFSSAPANTAVIEITTIASANGSGGGASNTSIRAQSMVMGIIFGG